MWAEELIEPARAADHRRLAFLYVVASMCWMAGRIETAVGYGDAGQGVIGSGGEVPSGLEGLLGIEYVAIGQPERCVAWCRAQLARGQDTHTITRAILAIALAATGCQDEAIIAAAGLIDAAEATRNPFVQSNALLTYGYACRDADPAHALAALRRGLVIARDSGNRYNESGLAATLARLEADCGDPLLALEYLALAIRNYHDSGSTEMIRVPLASLALLFDRLRRPAPAAIIAGFALSPFIVATVPELDPLIGHLREVLSDQTYESLARKGETMTTAEIVTYAYDQIDQARGELNAVSK